MQVWHLKLVDLVYADGMCIMAGSPQHLQFLIDALVNYCARLHMEISVAKTKMVVVSNPSAGHLLYRQLFSLAMAFLWGVLTLSNTLVCTFMHQGIYLTLSPLSRQRQLALGVWYSRGILQCGSTVNLEVFVLTRDRETGSLAIYLGLTLTLQGFWQTGKLTIEGQLCNVAGLSSQSPQGSH